MLAIKKKGENDDEEILLKVYKIIKRDLLIQEVMNKILFILNNFLEKQFNCEKS